MRSDGNEDVLRVEQRGSATRRRGGWLVAALCGLLAVQGARAATFGIERMSMDSGGVQSDGYSVRPAISQDGRYVAFVSGATNLVVGDTNGTEDVFVRDRQLGTTERVSIASDGSQSNGSSSVYYSGLGPTISNDGRYVAFLSSASNLITDSPSSGVNVFVRDRQLGVTECVSVGGDNTPAGNCDQATISGNGRYVAFASGTANLTPGDINGRGDVFVRDRQLGTTELISLDSIGNQMSEGSEQPSISDDGRYVSFVSWASNLIAGDTTTREYVFLRDRQLGTTELVSRSSAGTPSNGRSTLSAVSGDGRYVAFLSFASNLVANDLNETADVFLRDRQLGTIERVSLDSSGNEANNVSFPPLTRGMPPTISRNGRYVAFMSEASNLVADDTNERQDVFVRDRQLGATARVSVNSSGVQEVVTSINPAISSDGTCVAFESDASNLTAGDTNGTRDIFVAGNPLFPNDTTPPTLSTLAVGTTGASNGLAYIPVKVMDSGSGVIKVQLTANSSNCHLEYPLGTRVVTAGTPRPHTLILPGASATVTVYAVKDSNATARVEVRAWDAADNTALLDPVIANLQIKQGRRLTRQFNRIPAAEHYVVLQNGTPGLANATLWVNGRVVSRGSLSDGQTVALNVATAMRPGKRNTVRIAASGPKGASAVLTIGDTATTAGIAALTMSSARATNLEFSQ